MSAGSTWLPSSKSRTIGGTWSRNVLCMLGRFSRINLTESQFASSCSTRRTKRLPLARSTERASICPICTTFSTKALNIGFPFYWPVCIALPQMHTVTIVEFGGKAMEKGGRRFRSGGERCGSMSPRFYAIALAYGDVVPGLSFWSRLSPKNATIFLSRAFAC